MFHTYVATVCSKGLICSSLPLQQVFSCCKLQVLYLDVAYVFTYMLQLYVLDVLAVSDICCIQVFSCCMCFMLFRESGAWRSDGGTSQAVGNGRDELVAGRRGAQRAGRRWLGARQGRVRLRGVVNGWRQGAWMGAGRIKADGADCERVVLTQ
jgi:hypothetical protein